MKRLLLIVLVSLFGFQLSATSQELVGSTRTLESAQRQHREKLKQAGVVELVGVCRAQNTRQGRQGVKSAAAALYADACVRQLAARIKADKKATYGEEELRQFEALQARYATLLKEFVEEEASLSFMVREKHSDGDEYKGFFTLNEEVASHLRLQALERMPQDDMAQKWVRAALSFVSEPVSVKVK